MEDCTISWAGGPGLCKKHSQASYSSEQASMEFSKQKHEQRPLVISKSLLALFWTLHWMVFCFAFALLRQHTQTTRSLEGERVNVAHTSRSLPSLREVRTGDEAGENLGTNQTFTDNYFKIYFHSFNSVNVLYFN